MRTFIILLMIGVSPLFLFNVVLNYLVVNKIEKQAETIACKAAEMLNKINSPRATAIQLRRLRFFNCGKFKRLQFINLLRIAVE